MMVFSQALLLRNAFQYPTDPSKIPCFFQMFGKIKELEYETKNIANDMHRMRWEVGDWTDDSDQMILIMQSLLDNNGKVLYYCFHCLCCFCSLCQEIDSRWQ